VLYVTLWTVITHLKNTQILVRSVPTA